MIDRNADNKAVQRGQKRRRYTIFGLLLVAVMLTLVYAVPESRFRVHLFQRGLQSGTQHKVSDVSDFSFFADADNDKSQEMLMIYILEVESNIGPNPLVPPKPMSQSDAALIMHMGSATEPVLHTYLRIFQLGHQVGVNRLAYGLVVAGVVCAGVLGRVVASKRRQKRPRL